MTTEEREQQRRDDCRSAVLAYLHDRPHVAQSADTIARTMRSRGHDFTADEVKAACLFWNNTSPKDMEIRYRPGGGTPHFQITSQGILTHERSLV